MHIKIRKPIALLLAVMMVAGLFSAMPVMASAEDPEGPSRGREFVVNLVLDDDEVKIMRKLYDCRSDNNIGEGDTVYVTGRTALQSRVPINVNIPGGSKMVWSARLGSHPHNTGVYLNLTGDHFNPGTFEVADGGLIYMAGSGTALYNEVGHDIIIQEGGEVSCYGGFAISSPYGGDITVNGGVVRNEYGYGFAIYVSNTETVVRINGGLVESLCRNGKLPYAAIFTQGDVHLFGGRVISHIGSPIIANRILYGSGSGMNGVSVGWHNNTGIREFPIGSTTDIIIYGGEAK